MSFDGKSYHKEWMRRHRMQHKQEINLVLIEIKRKRLLAKGKCPVCEMLLVSQYHIKCPFLLENNHSDD